MANTSQFKLFITCVDSVGPLLKLWGQSDQTSMVFVERFLQQLTPEFEKGRYVPNIASLKVGQLCVGKYKDGEYYRAKVLDLSQIRDGLILVHFIDHGNTESLQLTSIRVVDGPSPLTSFMPLSNEYILAGVINTSQTWNPNTFLMLTNMVCNMELSVIAHATVGPYKIITIQFKNEDLSKILIKFNEAVPCSISTQAQILTQKLNPTSATTEQHVNRPRPPQVVQQDKHYVVTRRTSAPMPGTLVEETPAVFKNTILPIHSEHLVTVSAVEDGPKSFTLQIQSWEKYLHKLMMDLNTLFTVSLSEIPVPGTLCIAVNSLNRSLCRAVITQVIEDNCKVYFVDFGNSEVISYSELYQLPPTFISHKILALRFALSNLKSINITPEIKNLFKEFVSGKTFKLRVMPPEGPPVLQYGELFDEKGVNVLTILKTTLGLEVLKFRQMGKQETDCIADVAVAYIKTCQEFYVHFLSDIDALNRLMVDLSIHCQQNEHHLARNRIQAGMACCALFPDDGQWYRAEILGSSGNEYHVKYVDYGNEGIVTLEQVQDIPIELVNRLPVQAIRCCLIGYENEPINQSLSRVFENIALENNYTMKIVKYHTPQILLVNLLDMSSRVLITKTLLDAQKQTPDVIPEVPVYSPPSSTMSTGDNYFDSKKKPRNRSEDTPPRFRKKEIVHGKAINERLQRRLSPNVPSRGDESNKGKFRNNDNTRSDFNKNRSPRIITSPNNNERQARGDWNKNNTDKRYEKSPVRKPSWNDSRKENTWNDLKKDSAWNDSKKGNSQWNDAKHDSRKKEGWNDSKKENFKPRESRRDNRKDFKKESHIKSDSDSNNERRFDRSKKNFNKKSPPKFELHKRTGSQSSDKSDLSFRKKRFEKPRISNIPYVAPPPDYAGLSEKYTELDYAEGSIENVAISYYYNPRYFYIRITSMESEFKKMMTEIHKMYKSRSPIQDTIPAGSSVIAHFSEDNLLYRATVLDVRLDKYKVRYIDYGNTNFVDKSKVWQVEKKFMELPAQSIVCTLPEIYPTGETWNDSPEMDNCFNKGNYQCVFHAEFIDNKRVVSLSHNGLLITDDLINRGLATSSANILPTNELNDSNISQHIPGIEHDIEDAPIDLGLLLEQQLRITVSYAYGLERFFVYLDKSKAEDVIKQINDHAKKNSSTLELLTLEQIVNGTVCLMQTDSGWQRCIISNPASTNGIYVVFPDMGGGEEMPIEKLYALPMDLTGYYYQSIECSLYNFELGCTQNISDEDFQTKYEGSELIAYVNGIQNGRLLVTLYDCDGNKLSLIKDGDSNEDALKISPLCPMPILNGNMKIWITHINSFDSLYIQRVADSQKVAELLNNLYQHYENNNTPRTDITINQLCAVKSIDGNWYRARVLEIKEGVGVNVIYIDYGNQETVDNSSVQSLDPKFYAINEYALHVALPITAENDITEQLKELTNGKEFYSKLAYTEGCWYIELYSDNVPQSLYLIETGIANKLDFDPFRRRFDMSCDNDESDNKITLCIAHVDSPNQFYAQLVDDQNSINTLQGELEKSIASLSDLQSPDAGVLCAAKYSADDVWYRAEVLDADDQITTVRFIDFGNTDVLDNTSGVIKTLPSHMLTIDRYAKKCSLDLLPIGEEWSQVACEMFEQKLVGQVCQANVLYQDKGVMYVSIYANDENITESLVNEGYGKPLDRDLEDELSNKTGFVSHINTIHEFWIQLESSCADLEMVSDQLSIADKFPDLSDKRPGMLCAARFPDDNDWYRARILSSTNDENVTQVLFIDYGNSSTTTELKMLPEQVINIRALALKCSLLKPAGIEDWPSDITDKFRELAADGATIFDVKVVATGETSIVELSIDNSNILETLLPNANTNTPQVVISNVISPDSFWIQFVDKTSILEDISNQLLEANNFEKVTNPGENTIYVSQHPEEESWYRSKVISKNTEGEFEVFSIDYGNSFLTQEIRESPTELASIDPQATHCCLKNSTDTTWNLTAGETLSELADYSNTTFEIKILEDKVPLLVSLYWEGKDVSEAINMEDESEPEEEEEVQSHETCRKIINAISAATNLNSPSASPTKEGNIPSKEGEELTNEDSNVVPQVDDVHISDNVQIGNQVSNSDENKENETSPELSNNNSVGTEVEENKSVTNNEAQPKELHSNTEEACSNNIQISNNSKAQMDTETEEKEVVPFEEEASLKVVDESISLVVSKTNEKKSEENIEALNNSKSNNGDILPNEINTESIKKEDDQVEDLPLSEDLKSKELESNDESGLKDTENEQALK